MLNTLQQGTIMQQTFLAVKARSTVSNMTVKAQDLTGSRWTLSQRSLAQESADQLAEKMSGRTGEPWVGFVEEYQPVARR
jgi:hypothetical protein